MTTAGEPRGKSTGMPPSTLHTAIAPRWFRKRVNKSHWQLHEVGQQHTVHYPLNITPPTSRRRLHKQERQARRRNR